jgi:hypothetical protein
VALVKQAVQNAIASGTATFQLTSIGTNEANEQVSVMIFEWSIRKK